MCRSVCVCVTYLCVHVWVHVWVSVWVWYVHVYVCRGVCVQCVGSYGTYQICRVNVRCVCMCVCMCVCGGKAEASVRDVCCHDNTSSLPCIHPSSEWSCSPPRTVWWHHPAQRWGGESGDELGVSLSSIHSSLFPRQPGKRTWTDAWDRCSRCTNLHRCGVGGEGCEVEGGRREEEIKVRSRHNITIYYSWWFKEMDTSVVLVQLSEF